MGRLAGTTIAAEYRCTKCWRRASLHPKGDVKGCKKGKIGDDDYLDDLELQVSELKAAIAILEENYQMQAEHRELKAQFAEGERMYKELDATLSSSLVKAKQLVAAFKSYERDDTSWDVVRPILADLAEFVGDPIAPQSMGASKKKDALIQKFIWICKNL